MDELDKYIYNIVNAKINEHSNYEYIIKNTLKKSKKHSIIYDIFIKIILSIVSIYTIGGLVFATQLL